MSVQKKSTNSTARRTSKSSTSKKKSASSSNVKRTKKKKIVSKKHVKLDKGKVTLLTSIIFLVCCILLSVNILSMPEKKNRTEKNTSISKLENNSTLQNKNKKFEEQSKPKTPVTQTKVPTVPPKENIPSKKQSSPIIENKPTVKKSENKESVQTKQIPQKKPFDIPPAKNNATIVIVIDDAGLNLENCRRYTNLPFPITIAVLPKLKNTKSCASLVVNSGKELILHQPMQSFNHELNPGPGKISVEMTTFEVAQIVKENLDELGIGVKGINNHEGSEVTSDIIKIGTVLDVCAERGVYFLDSRTTANTKAPQAALERDMRIFEKSGPYIDNVISRDAMLKELYKSLDVANKNGKTIIIGHVDKSVNILPALLQEMYPYMKEAGYKFATPSMLYE